MTPSLPKPNIRGEEEALFLLARATDLLASCTDYEATLDFIASLLVSTLAQWCTIDLLSEDGQVERVSVAHRDPAKSEVTRQMLLKYPAKPSAKRGVYRVIETGKAILIPHTPESTWVLRADSPEHLQMIMELGSSSYMCVPLSARGRVVGAVMLLSSERVYDETDLNTAERLARCIAMAVDNVSMFRKLKATQDQLIHSAKLAALGVISAGIAHEINNPLTIIKGQLKCFEIYLQKNESSALEHFVAGNQKINNSIDRMTKIVRNIKDFSRQSKPQLTSVGLQNLIVSSLALFEDQFYFEDIKVHKNFPNETIYVLGDFRRLEQVLVNIFSNAQDAIKSQLDRRGGNIHIQLTSNDSGTEISITDDGIGVNPAFAERVFEPFFTTKGVGEGTGLGLSISHGIIKDHGGKIEFISEEDQGVKIVIGLPAFQFEKEMQV